MSQWHLRFAASVIRHGGIVACPTESSFGFSCDPLNPDAIERLLSIKNRSPQKGFILIAADYRQLSPYIGNINAQISRRIRASWPGPITWLLPAADNIPSWITGMHYTVAVRITAHPLAAALCHQTDMALISTSANRTDFAPARTALAIKLRFGHEIDCVLPGTIGRDISPTLIKDAISGKTIRPYGANQ